MTDAESIEHFRRSCQRYVAENTRTPEAARECLVRIGIYLPSGEMAPEYRK